MRVVCSFCRKELGTKPPLKDGSVTHGMCPACSDHFTAQWSGMSWDQYLERFEFPVLMVEEEVRLVALNRPATALLGRPAEEVIGLLGGEALECSHSRLPEGCGRTVHCSTCTIRNTVNATHRTGKPQRRVPATLRRRDGSKPLLVSTALEGKLVRVTIEPPPAGEAA
jgi:PAS domain-containing protein